jgi:regulator of protease activity HflC (stomatin/prohibitin superfamily)
VPGTQVRPEVAKSVVAIENVRDVIDQIAQTTLRKVVGQHSLDQTLPETDKINLDICKILDGTTVGDRDVPGTRRYAWHRPGPAGRRVAAAG